MGDWFLGEIRLFSIGWQPEGWVQCAGQSMDIKANAALYALLGTTYGGDGVNNFLLPDLRGRAVVSRNYSNAAHPVSKVGIAGGTETVVLTAAQLPPHTHAFNATSLPGNFPLPAGADIAQGGNAATETTIPPLYGPPAIQASSQIPLNDGTISQAGGGQGHPNMQPFQVLNYCIATQGIFPPRN